MQTTFPESKFCQRSTGQTQVCNPARAAQYGGSGLSRLGPLLCLLCLCFLAAVSPAQAGYLQAQEVVATDGAAADEFGNTIAVDGDLMVVGAPYTNSLGIDSGAVYIYGRDQGGIANWGQIAKLVASDGANSDHFGADVAIEGHRVVVGARYGNTETSSTGAAYVFEKDHGGIDNWGEVAKMVPSSGVDGDTFGAAVAVSGDTIVVGAPLHDAGEGATGIVYVFSRNSGGTNKWGETTSVTALVPQTTYEFGSALSLDGEQLIVGAPASTVEGENSGAAYLFERDYGGTNNWGEVTRIVPTGIESGDQFGVCVSISGGTAVVGAPGYDVQPSDELGAAFVFTENKGGVDNWGQTDTLLSWSGESSFGFRCNIAGDAIIVGEPWDSSAGQYSGAVYTFIRETSGAWESAVKVAPDNSSPGDFFGASVDVSRDTLVVGATQTDQSTNNSGSAYVFRRTEWAETKLIVSSDNSQNDYFGYSVAISKDTMIIGAPLVDDSTITVGAAYIFERNFSGLNAWAQKKKLLALLPEDNDFFGDAVDIDGDIAVVGMQRDDDTFTDSGSVYVFSRNQGGIDNWGLVKKLTAPNPNTFAFFGDSVSVSDDIIAVGAPYTNTAPLRAGSVYIFERDLGGVNNWGYRGELRASDGAAFDYMGRSVSISGDTLVVGSTFDDDGGSRSGSAYLFERNQGGTNNWGEVTKLTAPDGAAQNEFGFSVDIDGDVVVVGSPFDDEQGSNSGSAYVFDRDGNGPNSWAFRTKLLGKGSGSDDWFGHAVSVAADIIVIGTPRNNTVAAFQRNAGGLNQWNQVKTLASDSVFSNDLFGFSAAVDGGTAVIGARLGGNTDTGTAHVFDEVIVFSCESDVTGVVGTAGNDLLLGTTGNDLLRGLSGEDELMGLEGDDLLLAGSGNDVLRGGLGDDYIDGCSGVDTVSYDSAASAVTVDLGNGIATGEGLDSIINVENVIGSVFDDVIAGSSGPNFMGAGDGTDTADYSRWSSRVVVQLNSRAADVDGDGNFEDTLLNFENSIAGSGDDKLTGNHLSNVLRGGDGDDEMRGHDSSDTLIGEGGSDLIYGGNGDDLIFGGDGDDRLNGQAGNDILYGGHGRDYYWSNGGVNRFVFENESAFAELDQVRRFTPGPGGDIIDVADILENYDAQNGVDEYVRTMEYGDGTLIEVDPDGASGLKEFMPAVWVRFVSLGSASILVVSGNLVLE